MYRVVVFGEKGTGKSALVVRFAQDVFVSDYEPTLENSYQRLVSVDGKDVPLNVVDTAGEEEYSIMTDAWIRMGHGFILAYSITSNDGFKQCEYFHNKILSIKDVDCYPCVVIGTKSDLVRQRMISKEEGQQFADTIGAPFFETSAKEMIHVHEVFLKISSLITALGLPPEQSTFFPTIRKKQKQCLLM